MKILLCGATGQMGLVLTGICQKSDKYEIVSGVAESPVQGGVFPISSEFAYDGPLDVIIDFSSPKALTRILGYAVERKIPAVIASTGHSPEQIDEVKRASESIPILFSGNLSLGVNVMQAIVKKLAHMLPDFDVEIVEKHHRLKKDSPSGTAKMLFESVNLARGSNMTSLQGRGGFYDSRPTSEVGISSVRGGTIVGEHSVIFCGLDEVIEISHSAASKAIFANGAIKAAEFLTKATPGLYNMNDVLE